MKPICKLEIFEQKIKEIAPERFAVYETLRDFYGREDYYFCEGWFFENSSVSGIFASEEEEFDSLQFIFRNQGDFEFSNCCG